MKNEKNCLKIGVGKAMQKTFENRQKTSLESVLIFGTIFVDFVSENAAKLAPKSEEMGTKMM